MDLGKGLQKHFDTELGLTIRANGPALELLSAVILLPVDGGSGGEEEAGALIELLHCLEQVDGSNHVVLVVVQGHDDGFVGILLGREVDDAFNGGSGIPLLLEHGLQELKVKDVALLDMDKGAILGGHNFKKSVGDVLLAVGVVVDHHDFRLPHLQDLQDCVAADVAQTSG